MILGVLQSMLTPEQTDLKLRAAAYSAVGQLGQKLPDVISKDFSIIQMFFKALEEVRERGLRMPLLCFFHSHWNTNIR